jgi:hypothetical protein
VQLQKLIVREPQPQPERPSPVAEAPRPTWLGGRAAIEPVDPMPARERWGYVFWGILAAFILATEAVAAFWDDFWVPTISGTTGGLEQRHDWLKLIVLGVITVVGARIAFYPWPYRKIDD